jgi:multidrug resistance efflux pump
MAEVVVQQGAIVKKGEVLFRIKETRGQGDKETRRGQKDGKTLGR